jgi:hypothetical protein
MLQLPPEWVFGSPGALPSAAVEEFLSLILRVANQGESWAVLEHFKSAFGTSSRSSSASWALSDLRDAMDRSAENAPVFIANFWKARAGMATQHPNHSLPDERVVNALLTKHQMPFEVKPPHLIQRHGQPAPIVKVPEASVGESAKALINRSLGEADRFLQEGKPRQAVQEVLWLLETVSTAFEGRTSGRGTVQGKYFNDIIRDLRRNNDGTVLAQAGGWMKTLHGFLSSPSGGGIRHGAQLSGTSELKLHEATLYCNLTRSYIGYLLAELDAHPPPQW